jgi:hypothetical protein
VSKVKIEIKSSGTGSLLFKYKSDDATIKEAVESVVSNDVSLGDAYLGGSETGRTWLVPDYT